jgi:hypothetical protein
MFNDAPAIHCLFLLALGLAQIGIQRPGRQLRRDKSKTCVV